MKKVFVVLLIVCVVLILGCTHKDQVIIGNEKIDIEIADTSKEIQDGLMFREGLCSDCGMLFILKNEGYPSFWMKNTLIPLEMIFINSNLEIVDVLEAEPCFEEVCDTYVPKDKAIYVLEVNKNRFGKDVIGMQVEIK